MKTWWLVAAALSLLVVYLSGFWWPLAPAGPVPQPGWGMMGTGRGHGMMRGGMMGGGMMGGWGQAAPAAVSQDGAPATGSAIPADAIGVNLQQMRFAPATLEVKAGTAVTFVNRDGYAHRVVQSTLNDLGKRTPVFVSPILDTGSTWTYTFSEPGRYPILCDVAGHHLAGMVGVIEVVA